jgi:hypothetical protein
MRLPSIFLEDVLGPGSSSLPLFVTFVVKRFDVTGPFKKFGLLGLSFPLTMWVTKN